MHVEERSRSAIYMYTLRNLEGLPFDCAKQLTLPSVGEHSRSLTRATLQCSGRQLGKICQQVVGAQGAQLFADVNFPF